MFKLYTKGRAERIIVRYDGLIREIEADYGLPAPALQAVLYKEITGIDLADLLADAAVSLYWRRVRLRSLLRRWGWLRRLSSLPRPLLGKRDSSTGYGQVYAATALASLHFAEEQGLVSCAALGLPPPLAVSEDPAALGDVWRRLYRDRAFNLRAAALTLLAAAEEMAGSLDWSSFSPETLQLVFTRYNANTRRVTQYGKEVYNRYLVFAAGSSAAVFNTLNT